MIEVLEPLAELPGVRMVMLVTSDGVPIAVPGKSAGASNGEDELSLSSESGLPDLGRNDALAAIATGWLGEIQHAVGQNSWTEPNRVVLKGARGTLVLQRAKNSILFVLLARGLAAEEVRLSMKGAIKRLERNVNSAGRDRTGGRAAHGEPEASPESPLPARSVSRTDEVAADAVQQGHEPHSSKD